MLQNSSKYQFRNSNKRMNRYKLRAFLRAMFPQKLGHLDRFILTTKLTTRREITDMQFVCITSTNLTTIIMSNQAFQKPGAGYVIRHPLPHQPESSQTLFSALAMSMARVSSRRSRCRSWCAEPFARIVGLPELDAEGDGRAGVLALSGLAFPVDCLAGSRMWPAA